MTKVADYIADFLAEKQVSAVFELVGGMITFLIDSLHRDGRIPLISMHHEQGAAFAAEGMARMSRIPGVAMATSGPGATNLITGIGSCYFDSTPAVFLTGQVNRSEQKGTSGVRQLGFQETDIVTMVQPIVKRAWLINDPDETPGILEEAFEIATRGRPGPVLIDIPMDVQRAEIQPSNVKRAITGAGWHALPAISEADSERIKESILRARKPLILAGGGIRAAGAAEAFRRLVETMQVPVVHSLMGVDVLPSNHPFNAGMIGSYGNRWSNLAISEADVLLVFGSRLDIRQTGADPEAFKGNREIFHIDCDAAELNNRVKGCYSIVAHLRPSIEKLIDVLTFVSSQLADRTREWVSTIQRLRDEWPDTQELKGIKGINPNRFMHDLGERNQDAAAYVVDVGQHQMWAAQSLAIGVDQRFLTSGGMGSMGFGLPAAIGAAISRPGKAVVMIAGDGSFQCNIQELQTVAHLQLPLRMVVIHNKCLGMVRQFQQSYFHGRYQSTMWGYSAPDFTAVAKAYGIPSRTISEPDECEEAGEWLVDSHFGPKLLQVMVSPEANAYPKLAFGKGMASMEPLVLSEEMEST